VYQLASYGEIAQMEQKGKYLRIDFICAIAQYCPSDMACVGVKGL
jgi:hypothetical protein